jgi:prepilin peptidase CpaA
MRALEPPIAIQLSMLLALLGTAAVFDVRCRRIPNLVSLGGVALGVLSQVWIAGAAGLFHGLVGCIAGMLVFLPGFLLRFTGAGDVKMMGAVGAFLGPAGALLAGAASMVAGAAIAVVTIALKSRRQGLSSPWERYSRMLKTWAKSGRLSYIPAAKSEVMGQRIPQGVAIAIGTLGMLLLLLWRLPTGA